MEIVAVFIGVLVIGAFSRMFMGRKSWLGLIAFLALISVGLWAVMR